MPGEQWGTGDRPPHACRLLPGARRGGRTAPQGAQQRTWQSCLEREQENLRTALQWLIERDEAELALRYFGSLAHYWVVHGYLGEGRRWLEAISGMLQTAPRC